MERAREKIDVPLQSPAELRAELRAGIERSAQQTQLALARGVAVTAVRAYWSALAPTLPIVPLEENVRIPEALLPGALNFGKVVATLDVADAAFHLGLLYTSFLPGNWRAERGVHYTPPALANRLLDQAEQAGLDWSHAHILDPAAGAGAFLVPAAKRLLNALGPCSPIFAIEHLSSRIRGYELDPFAAWMAQVFVEALALPLIKEARHRLRPVVGVCDSLASLSNMSVFDLVIGNPPFGRVTLRKQQRERFSRSLYGHANLYGLFLDLAVRLAKPGGLVSFLTPSSFLAGEYFKNLRSLMSSEAPPVTLDFVHLRKGVFEDVLQETVLATYRKGADRTPAKVFFVHPHPAKPIIPEEAGTFVLPEDRSAPWVLPRHADEATLARRLREMPDRLADWGYGVSTGPLVWNRFKEQLRDKPSTKTVPLIWAECVTSDGRFVFRSEKRNHRPYFRLQSGDDWLLVDEPCVLLQRTTAKEQARRLIAAEMPASFIRDHGGVTVENHLNMLVPIVDKPNVSPRLLAAFLNTVAADRAFRCLSGSVAVSAYELENLPVPSASELQEFVGKKWDREKVEIAAGGLYAETGDL